MDRAVKCKSCGKKIYFLPTTRGKSIPVNAESLDVGERIDVNNGAQIFFSFGRHIAHFTDCPDADKHRRSK